MHNRLGFGCENKILDIYELKCTLHKLGVTPKYKGYHYFIEAYKIAIDDPWSLTLITKLIYPVVAKRYKTTTTSVERELRRTRDLMWLADPALLSHICQLNLSRSPSVSFLLSAIVGVSLTKENKDGVKERE